MQRPPNPARNLRRADRSRQPRPVRQLAHQRTPQPRATPPRLRIVARIHQRHHAIANQHHRHKVFRSFWLAQEHINKNREHAPPLPNLPNSPRYHRSSMVFVLDNYDSFTYNLVQYIGELGQQEIVVRRNDEITPDEIIALKPTRILLSPGPCTPQDAGILIPLIQRLAQLPAGEQIPTLGVCLGHQAIGAAFGAEIVRAPELMHGKTSEVEHDGRTVFRNLPAPMTCTRYHSLIVREDSIPDTLEISARVAPGGRSNDAGTIMGLRHRTLPIEGVQFHPESVLTAHGKQLIANFLKQ